MYTLKMNDKVILENEDIVTLKEDFIKLIKENRYVKKFKQFEDELNNRHINSIHLCEDTEINKLIMIAEIANKVSSNLYEDTYTLSISKDIELKKL